MEGEQSGVGVHGLSWSAYICMESSLPVPKCIIWHGWVYVIKNVGEQNEGGGGNLVYREW